MLSSVLNSERAISVNIKIIRAFEQLRQILASNAELSRDLTSLKSHGIRHVSGGGVGGVDAGAVFAESLLAEAQNGWNKIADRVSAAKRSGVQSARLHRPPVLNQ